VNDDDAGGALPDGGTADRTDTTGSDAAYRDTRLDGYEAVVYDLDGTLVELAVDWDGVGAEATALSNEYDVDVSGMSLWDMFDADGTAHAEAVERLIGEREREGARASERLPLADDLVARDGALGVCSLNSEPAVHDALDTHDLARHVDAVVGRGTVPQRKPSPEPLLETLQRLDVSTEEAVFVGDSDRDALTADRADVAFVYVEGADPSHRATSL
jgi:phosphoglycolate phosphatase